MEQVWYIKIGGQLKGPFPSKEAASAQALNEGWNAAEIVPGTRDGKEILFS